jgi:hypothetical protein
MNSAVLKRTMWSARRLRFRGIALTAPLLLCLSCKTSPMVESTLLTATGVSNQEGFVYFLPKHLMQLTLDRVPTTLDALKKVTEAKMTAAKEALEAAKAAEGALKAQTAIVEALAAQHAKAAEPEKTAAGTALAEARGLLEMLRAKKAVADAALAEAQHGKAAADQDVANYSSLTGPHFKDTLVLTRLPAVADPRYPIVARLKHAKNRDDELTLQVTESGLLSAATGKATDQTAAIVAEVAKIIIDIAKLAAGVPPLPGPAAEAAGAPPQQRFGFHLEEVFDPAICEEVASINRELTALVTPYQIVVQRGDNSVYSTDAECARLAPPPPPQKLTLHGLAYRRLVPFRFRIMGTVSAGSSSTSTIHTIKSAMIELPNDGPIAHVDYPARWWATNEHSSEFKNGVLTKHVTTQPAEALGGVRTLANVVRQIVGLPGELIQLKIDYSSKDAAQLAAEKAVLDAEAALAAAKAAATQHAAAPPAAAP